MPWVNDESNENANPNDIVTANFKMFKTIIENSNEKNLKKRLIKLFENSNLEELKQMYEYSNLHHNKDQDAYEDAAKMLDTYIDEHEEDKIQNEHLKMQSEFNELITNADPLDLVDAYKFTLYPKGHAKYGDVKPGYDDASKFLDTLLENKGVSRDPKGNVYIITREFGTPYDPMRHRKTHTKSSPHRGGSYKKRRTKKRTKTAKKTRKHRK
jgi:hypothetical protein